MRRLLVITLSLLLAVVATVGALAIRHTMHTPLPVGDTAIRIEIAPGAALSRVAADLSDQHLLPYPRIFVWYARFHGDASRIKAGEYELLPGTTAARLVDLFVSGKVLMHSLTVIEGWTYEQMRDAIREHAAINQTLGNTGDVEILARLGSEFTHPEGLFFPDTYQFPKGTSDYEILTRSYMLMQERVAETWEGRDPSLPFATPYEALILASIVEKETALEPERAQIAGVMIRRLERGMRLQTDPTVIYGLGPSFDGNIRRRDLTTDNPYNTYTRKGLPPTPIALAGAGSIIAAIHPESGQALFFVATGDQDGGHYFSATREEHNEAVQRYLERLRQQK